MNQMEEMKQFAIELAERSGKYVMEHFGKKHDIKLKKQKEMVSEADLGSERIIKSAIKEKYPDHSIVSEESDKVEGKSDYTWYIDPIDGTHNYLYGLPIFGVSIALAKDAEIILGVVNMPAMKEVFVAEKGKGAYCNGKRVYVSDRTENDMLFMNVTNKFLQKIKDNDKVMKKLANISKKVRVLGCAVFQCCYIAKGVFDISHSININSWDYAACALIVEEAGGKVTNFDGTRWTVNSKDIIASNGAAHDFIVKELNKK